MGAVTMTVMRKCRSCVSKNDCSIKDAILAANRGLGVTSIMHRCQSHKLPYEKGEAVMALVQAYPHSSENYHDPERMWFPAYFFDVASTAPRAIVFIAAGTPPDGEDEDSEDCFEPVGSGFCKVSWTRIKKRDAAPIRFCSTCEKPADKETKGGCDCQITGPRPFSFLSRMGDA